MSDRGTLAGRVAVVTGASSGIGEATARAFAARSARVLLGARRVDRLEALARDLGARAAFHPLDVTDPESCRRFADWATATAAVDTLVNNAGLARGLGPVADADEADWREMMEANVLGLMRLTRAFLPALLARDRADLVHVGSVAGVQPYANGAGYCASKAAVEAFAQALRLELAGTGVRQLMLEPGMAETEFSEVRFHGDRTRAAHVYEGMRPLTAVDIAECVAFAVERPPHVCLQRLLLMPTDQAAATVIARGPRR
ncbi:MAG: SDR family NAD(P)-dependent oxidoreductase [Polyangiaceae bacterium]|nr:SDR family NAD(P)-dependent oxidoreductase [Polyangiaceae bacterium]